VSVAERQQVRSLTRLQRITLVLFVIVVTNWVMVAETGYSLIGGDLFAVFLIVFLGLSGLTLIRPVWRKVALARLSRKADQAIDEHHDSQHAKK
jgi:uncharacterized membrane protein